MTDGTPDTDTDYAEQWEQLDEKVLLVQLLQEQRRTNSLLAELTAADTAADTPDQYRCTLCGTTVAGDEREDHGRRKHKTPAGMSDHYERQ